jgi:drug/metabolite transporter (DMT)-like permease
MAAAIAVPALAMSWWRTSLGAVALAPRVFLARRAELTSLARPVLARSAFAGLMLAGHFATWVSSLHYTSVASATALVSLQVAWVVVLARLGGTPVSRPVALGLALGVVGVVVVSGVDLTVSVQAAYGDLLALAGGVFAAFYIVAGAQVRAHASTATYGFLCYAVCAAILLALCVLLRVPLVGFSTADWLRIILVTVVAQLLGHTIFNHLLAVVSATLVSMAYLLEVPGAALLAAVFLGQTPPLAVYLGLLLILVGLALVVRSRGAQDATVDVPAA